MFTNRIAAVLSIIAAISLGTGIVTPRAGQAQGLPGRNINSEGNYLFGNLVRSGGTLILAPSDDFGIYGATKRTTGGYHLTIQSKVAFGTIADGNYLFVVSPDGNYLFTGLSDGRLMTSGGWCLTRGGDVIAPDGSREALAGRTFTTPEGYTFAMSKDGTRGLVLPDGSVFVLQDTVSIGMDPADLYYD